MSRRLFICALVFGLLVVARTGWARAAPLVVVIDLDGAVSPGTADYVVRGLESAAADQAQLVVLKMDTPGGLGLSMRRIIKKIVASPVPVAAFVAPEGARAASAGTYLLYACHIAAMAPATNLGAATPISIGIVPAPQSGSGAKKQAGPPETTEQRKQINDAAAYIRSLAQMRGRNAQWAELAVRKAVSLTANEALKLKVIDLVAPNVPDLLLRLDGRKVSVRGAARILHLAGARIVTLHPDWRSRLLTVIADPSIAYMLMLAGALGLFFEFSNPGLVLPGVAGAISLLLALFGFQLLPINYAGLGLIVLGLLFMGAEAFVPSFGALGLGGVAAFVIGSAMLVDTGVPGYGIPWAVIIPVALGCALFVFLVAGMAVKAWRRPVRTGSEQMIGSIGRVLEDFDGTNGRAQVHGETWQIRSARPLARGQTVKVIGIEGLVLQVEAEKARND